ncbi:MAG: hypothetical protein II858_00265 [Bacteroidales bacterium]|nr:hypothetical protein [Bacteroidales bacterium]
MSIINSTINRFHQEEPHSFASLKQTVSILSHDNEFVDKVLDCFSIMTDEQTIKKPLQIGNVRHLLEDISELDQQTKKIDVIINLKDIYLERVLDNDHVLFHLYGITDPELIKAIKADHIIVESQYSARTDIMEYYQFSKFASFLHSNNMDEFAQLIWEKIRVHANREKKCMARLIYHIAEDKYYIRAVASESGYKKYGVNFSALVALLAVDKYVKDHQEQAFIESYDIDDSHILMSIQFNRKILLEDDMYLTLNLALANDEIRQSSVTLNAEFRVVYKKDDKESDIILKPTSYQKEHGTYSEDMLTYSHGMNVETAIERISDLPALIDKYITLISKNAIAIKSIKNPKQVKDFIQQRIQLSRKEEFIGYKAAVVQKLASIEVNTIFDLFELLRSVEDLFGDDIKSKSFWRQKLYDALINRGKDD